MCVLQLKPVPLYVNDSNQSCASISSFRTTQTTARQIRSQNTDGICSPKQFVAANHCNIPMSKILLMHIESCLWLANKHFCGCVFINGETGKNGLKELLPDLCKRAGIVERLMVIACAPHSSHAPPLMVHVMLTLSSALVISAHSLCSLTRQSLHTLLQKRHVNVKVACQQEQHQVPLCHQHCLVLECSAC